MTPREHEDGMRQEPTLSAAKKAEGFASVMKRLRSHSADERARLQTQAEEVVLGHEAYALGQEYLDRGDYEGARRWLRVAAGHHVPGAEQALEEIGLRQTLDGSADLAAVGCDQAAADAMSCGTIPSLPAVLAVDGNHRIKGDQPWASAMEGLYAGMAAAARAQAGRITARARRDADAILTEARQEAGRTTAACAQLVLDAERDRRQAAELLAEARQEAESVQSEIAEIAEGTRRSAREMLAKAEQEALLITDHARREAAQIRRKAQRQGGAPKRAGSQTGGHLFDKYWRASLAECAIEPSWDLFAPLWHAMDGPAHSLPVPTRPGQGALERMWQAPMSFTGTVLLLKCGADSGIRRWVQAPQEGDEQVGVGPKSWSVAWQVLIEAGLCDATSEVFERATRTCSDITGVVRQDGLRVLAIGVVKTDSEDTDDDAELGGAAAVSAGAQLAQGELFAPPARNPAADVYVPSPSPGSVGVPRLGPSVREFVRAAAVLPMTASAGQVRALLTDSPDVSGVLLVDQAGVPVRSVHRSRFLLSMSGRYGHALYADRPAFKLGDAPRVVGVDATAWEVLDVVAVGGRDRTSDDVAVVDRRGRCVGVVRLADLVRALAESRVEEAAGLNPLTRLPGSDTILSEVDRRIADGRPFALSWLDIDHFKQVNDGAGFAAGDELIRSVGRALQQAVSGHARVGHIGGDDFLVLADEVVLDRVVDAVLDTPWSAGGLPVTLSLATVVCTPGSVPDHHQAAAHLAPLKKAAKALIGTSWVLGRAGLPGHEVRRGVVEEVGNSAGR